MLEGQIRTIRKIELATQAQWHMWIRWGTVTSGRKNQTDGHVRGLPHGSQAVSVTDKYGAWQSPPVLRSCGETQVDEKTPEVGGSLLAQLP
jgi:hypothetical protein